jgi:hypothetical protein
MVQFSKIFTALVASTTVVSASHNVRRSAQAEAQSAAKAGIQNFQNLLSTFSDSIGTDSQISTVQLNTALEAYAGVLKSLSQFPGVPAGLPTASANATFSPNWEGAAIGAVVNAIIGLQVGALMGMTTTWTFNGLNTALTGILGFDPAAALSALAPPPGFGAPGFGPFPPPGLTTPAPLAPAPVAAPPSPPSPSPNVPVAPPKPVTPATPAKGVAKGAGAAKGAGGRAN